MLLVPTPHTSMDYVVPLRLCQEYMALTIIHLIGFCSPLYVRLSVLGDRRSPFNGMGRPYLNTEKFSLSFMYIAMTL